MQLMWPAKNSNEILDYKINWTDALDVDTIAFSTWSTGDASLIVAASSFTQKTAVVWLSGGTPGTTDRVSNTITTAGGRTFQLYVTLQIKS